MEFIIKDRRGGKTTELTERIIEHLKSDKNNIAYVISGYNNVREIINILTTNASYNSEQFRKRVIKNKLFSYFFWGLVVLYVSRQKNET